MKKLILVGAFLLITSTSHARDRWTGPTSPVDPMWGMSGSSIMVEALRPKPQANDLSDPNYLWGDSKQDKIDKLQKEVDRLKSERGEW